MCTVEYFSFNVFLFFQYQFLSEILRWRAQTTPDHVLYSLINAKVGKVRIPVETRAYTRIYCLHHCLYTTYITTRYTPYQFLCLLSVYTSLVSKFVMRYHGIDRL